MPISRHASAGSCLRGLLEGPRCEMAVLGGVAGRYAVLSKAGAVRGLARNQRPRDLSDSIACLERRDGLELPISLSVPPQMIDDALDALGRVTLGEGAAQTRSWRATVGTWRDDRVQFTTGALDSEAVIRLRDQLRASPRPREPAAVFGRVSAFSAALLRPCAQELRQAAEALIGLGLGSTPAGDDVLAAATATLCGAHRTASIRPQGARRLEILRAVITRHSVRTTPLSAALLFSAAHGRSIQQLRRLVSAASNGRGTSVALRGLLAVGHSSGYFLAAGALSAAATILADDSSQPSGLCSPVSLSIGDNPANLGRTMSSPYQAARRR